ncbi:MAG: hypothetical protein JXA03_13895 [Bacteroidales bacterium]|nr:hypothetical protein [Bacteroidales bacterium]
MFSLLSGLISYGQTGLSSPYTARGIGYTRFSGNLSLASMGGISHGMRDSRLVNFRNPASLTSIDTLSFVFESGVYGRYSDLKTELNSEETGTAGLTHILFGFPVTRWWKSSFGLLPFSQVGYHIMDVAEAENIGTVKHLYEGTGGINRAFWGNAMAIGKHFSVGMNLSYLFGTINKYQTVSFPDSTYVLNTKVNNAVTVSDVAMDFGLQGYFPLRADLVLNTGITFGSTSSLNVKRDYLARSFMGTISNIDIFRDTIRFEEAEKGILKLPGFLGAGFVLERKNKWLAGVDFDYEKWSEFSLYESENEYVDSYRISAGGQFSPDKVNGIKYYERIEYRAGFYYGRSNLNIRNTHLDELGITIGVGLPLLKSNSMLNFAIKTGRIGTTENNLIRESYIEFSAGVSLKEYWFYKRKYY